jgi:hypothetical protein
MCHVHFAFLPIDQLTPKDPWVFDAKSLKTTPSKKEHSIIFL